MCIISGLAKIENNWFRQCVTVLLVIFAEKANGKQENSLITVSRYLLPCKDDGEGPL